MKKNKDDEEFINNYSKIIMYIGGIVLAIIFVGYLFRVLIKSQGDMFSYSGAIIGGGLTLIGVVITIMYQEIRLREDKREKEEQRKDNLAIQYKPILKIKNLNTINSNHVIKVHTRAIKISFEIENIGRGECISLRSIVNYDRYTTIYLRLSTLPTKHKINVKGELNISNTEQITQKLPILVEYTDLYHMHWYRLTCWIYLELKSDNVIIKSTVDEITEIFDK